MLLAHRGGLPGVRRPLPDDAVFSWSTMTRALADQAPFWPPGSAHGYHVNSFGFVVGEPVVRRLGLRFADALRRHLTGPNEADFHIGLPRSEHARVAEVVLAPMPGGDAGRDAMMRQLGTGDPETDAMLRAAYANPPGLSGFGTVNRPEWRLASVPSTNGHGTARAVATLYDAFLHRRDGSETIVGPGLFREAIRPQSDGIDRVLRKPSRFGLGFQLSQPSRRVGSATGFGHYGYGGTLGFGDPESGVAFGYVMNRPGTRWSTPRTDALLDALDEALGRPAWKKGETGP
jgi:CubicO group peptidase (beta-lactamase class C family)